jgi:hypothetical protein
MCREGGEEKAQIIKLKLNHKKQTGNMNLYKYSTVVSYKIIILFIVDTIISII